LTTAATITTFGSYSSVNMDWALWPILIQNHFWKGPSFSRMMGFIGREIGPLQDLFLRRTTLHTKIHAWLEHAS